MNRLFVIALLTVVAMDATAHAGMVTVNAAGIRVQAQRDWSSALVEDNYTGTAIDGVDHNISASDVETFNDGTINFSETATQTVFDMSFTQFRTGSPGAFTYSYGVLWFTADEAGLTYSFDGAYTSADGYTALAVGAVDMTNSFSDVFYSSQATESGGDSFVVGGTGGGYPFSLSGNQSGSLIAGHQYQVTFDLLSQMWLPNVPDNGGNAGGYVRLTISRDNVAEVPEPASLTLFGLGALGLAFGRKRLRRT